MSITNTNTISRVTTHGYSDAPDNVSILPFIELIYNKLNDYEKEDYHIYFKHYHLYFPESYECRVNFKNDINSLFENNGIVFSLNDDGEIERQLSSELCVLMSEVEKIATEDTFDEMIKYAVSNIKKPNVEDHRVALEKLWDAFERMKTFYSNDKKKSANDLIEVTAKGNDGFKDILDLEFAKLTEIGNRYHIRHFEKDKIEISKIEHIDYLFYRMLALLDLCISNLPKDN